MSEETINIIVGLYIFGAAFAFIYAIENINSGRAMFAAVVFWPVLIVVALWCGTKDLIEEFKS